MAVSGALSQVVATRVVHATTWDTPAVRHSLYSPPGSSGLRSSLRRPRGDRAPV